MAEKYVSAILLGFLIAAWAVILVSSSCKDKLNNCHNYGDYACRSPYKGWAYNNCRNRCGLCNAHPCTGVRTTIGNSLASQGHVSIVLSKGRCARKCKGHSIQLTVPFYDGDDFHTSTNKMKMNQGIALTDEDRIPWLLAIHNFIKSSVNSHQDGIIACSALKKKYRKIILSGCSTTETILDFLQDNVVFIYLKGSASLLKDRLKLRTNHFMSMDLLDSQFAILEEPDNEERYIVVNVDEGIENIVQKLFNIIHK